VERDHLGSSTVDWRVMLKYPLTVFLFKEMGFEDIPSSEFCLVVVFVSTTINLWDSLVQKIVSPIKIIA